MYAAPIPPQGRGVYIHGAPLVRSHPSPRRDTHRAPHTPRPVSDRSATSPVEGVHRHRRRKSGERGGAPPSAVGERVSHPRGQRGKTPVCGGSPVGYRPSRKILASRKPILTPSSRQDSHRSEVAVGGNQPKSRQCHRGGHRSASSCRDGRGRGHRRAMATGCVCARQPTNAKVGQFPPAERDISSPLADISLINAAQ